MKIEGKVWCFGDDINTDLLQPMHTVFKPIEEQCRYVFEANRPGWVDEISPGDIIVAGRNFGTGSSRPAARLLRELGLGGLVADSINGLFFRNCVNFALPAVNCPGVSEIFREGDEGRLDLATGRVENLSEPAALNGRAWPPVLLNILEAGGLLEQLEHEDLLVGHRSRG
jgi:3-isopropylmalate/(R)-2-methylmalate dehydratase small subunit